MKPGIDILNVGDGDSEVTFDPAKEEDVKRAQFMIDDMMKRGFNFFILCPYTNHHVRVTSFDPKIGLYIIDTDSPIFQDATGKLDDRVAVVKELPAKRGRQRKRISVDPHKVRSTAIGASAGG